MRYLPEWFPGASFKTKARLWRQLLFTFTDAPYMWVKSQMSRGEYNHSFVSGLLEGKDREPGQDVTPHEEYIVRWSAASVYAGGADTVSFASQHPPVVDSSSKYVCHLTKKYCRPYRP